MDRKYFSKGTGRLDAQTLNDMNRAAWQVNQAPAPQNLPVWQGPYMAIVNLQSGTEAQELAWSDYDPIDPVPTQDVPIKWGYNFTVVAPVTSEDAGGLKLQDANSLCYETMGQKSTDAVALNLVELNNSSTSLMGVDPDNLPEGFALQPVPVDTHVMLWLAQIAHVEGDTTLPGNQGWVAYFSYPNQFDGVC
jgi:hypothetical protein